MLTVCMPPVGRKLESSSAEPNAKRTEANSEDSETVDLPGFWYAGGKILASDSIAEVV